MFETPEVFLGFLVFRGAVKLLVMTKSEMINEIFANVRWSDSSKKANHDFIMKHRTKESITRIYDAYLQDKGSDIAYATLLMM